MVAIEGGFEKAARQLHITQSAVSQRIKLLEAQTGQILLARTNPPRSTRAGQRMIKHYLQVKHLEDDLLDTFPPADSRGFATLAIGINGDSLATWFLDAVSALLKKAPILLDLRSDDQEQTHRLLKKGEVIGCISAKEQPMQGCRTDYLGRMDYRMVATPEFISRWFGHGMTLENFSRAPLLIFNRLDQLHARFFSHKFGHTPSDLMVHYLPSSERYADFISQGLAYGLLPDQQSEPFLASGQLVELLPNCPVPVRLHWHCWNLRSRLLEKFSRHLVKSARDLLPQ